MFQYNHTVTKLSMTLLGYAMKELADIKSNFPQWYLDVIAAAELADNSPSRGSMVIRPYGYAIWEHIQKILDAKLKEIGVENAYFPLFIPESYLTKEAEHVEGFSPELAVVTHAGGKKLEEPYVVRPTSETIIYEAFSRWINSWRDLPLKINQWANVVRWEMRTRPFLRTTEFLWQEGHTAHATKGEAIGMATAMLSLYVHFIQDYLAIPLVEGIKSESERFSGADQTYTMEAYMQDGKALQFGTSHVLSQKFSSAYGISFQDKQGNQAHPYCTSWAITTRSIGALIMVHGDQQGLIMPPKIAPIQVVIVPIYRKEEEKEMVLEKAKNIAHDLALQDVRVKIDDDEQKRPGAKYYHWDVRGVVLRIEIGPRDIANNQVMVANRLEQDKELKKTTVSFDTLSKTIVEMLESIQAKLLDRATQRMKQDWHKVEKIDDFGSTMAANNGFYEAGWCQSAQCESLLKKYKGTIRCLLPEHTNSVCFGCSQKSSTNVLIAKSY